MKTLHRLLNVLLEGEGGGEGGGGMMGGATPPAGNGGTPPPAGDAPTGWNYAEGVVGEGDRPEWFKEKYSTVDAQAKAYGDLESRFGSFTGAPDEYSVEGMPTEGEGAIMVETIKEIAKDSNMNQETFNKIVESIGTNIDGYRETFKQEQMDAAIKSIPNFENRREALAGTAQTFLTTDQFNGLNSLMSTVDGFEAVEALTAQLRGGSLPGSLPPAQQRETRDITGELNALNGSDIKGRNKLLEEYNKSGDGVGKLV